MRRLVLAATAVAAAAGCDRGGREMSVNEVAAELRNVRVEPGLWESTTRIVDVSGRNLPVELRNQMLGERTTRRNCITPEQAERPDANFFTVQQNQNCSYRDFTMRGGRLEGSMTCTQAGAPGEMTTRMSGEYGPERYDMTLRMETSGMPADANLVIEARTEGRRVGDCPAGGEEEEG